MYPKILIAEDESEIAELLKLGIEPDGYTVVNVFEGTGLIERIRVEKPALIIMDVLLPGIDGYTIMLQLSQDDELCAVPVMVITALPASKDMFDKFEQVKAFVVKPFEMASVLEIIKKNTRGAL